MDLSKNELAYALLRSLQHLDATPPGHNYGDQRTEADRDEGRRIGRHILNLVPDMGELAEMAVRLWVADLPSLLKESYMSYYGPDVFRSRELSYFYPDDSGVVIAEDDWDTEIPSWADRNDLAAQEDIFHDKALLVLQRERERYKERKRIAAAEKRREKLLAKRQEEQAERRRSATIRQMMSAATAPSSDARH